jgi:hypothetical protein
LMQVNLVTALRRGDGGGGGGGRKLADVATDWEDGGGSATHLEHLAGESGGPAHCSPTSTLNVSRIVSPLPPVQVRTARSQGFVLAVQKDGAFFRERGIVKSEGEPAAGFRGRNAASSRRSHSWRKTQFSVYYKRAAPLSNVQFDQHSDE